MHASAGDEVAASPASIAPNAPRLAISMIILLQRSYYLRISRRNRIKAGVQWVWHAIKQARGRVALAVALAALEPFTDRLSLNIYWYNLARPGDERNAGGPQHLHNHRGSFR